MKDSQSFVPFKQVDVFTAVPYKGNPVAVILNGNGLSPGHMQSIARWTNLSETTFVLSPKNDIADYQLRIFTPTGELPFAGHPTIGSAWAMLEHGLKPKSSGRLVQECAKGLINLRVVGKTLFFALPEPVFTASEKAQVASVAVALGLPVDAVLLSSVVDVGAVWLTIQLRSAEEVIALTPDMSSLAKVARADQTGVCVFGLYKKGSSPAVEVRAFAPAAGVPEDPVCGSGNGCVAAMIRRHGVLHMSQYVASEGRCLGRDGRVEVEYEDAGTIWLGGRAVTCVDGSIACP